MKIKTTKKQIQNNYKNIIKVGYGDLQYLLRFKNPTFFTAGVYGWNADIYQIDHKTAICTGYRPYGNIENYKIVDKYEEEAKKIINKNISYNEQKQTLNELLENFINEVLNNE